MSDRSWALLFVRLLLGLIFFMWGVWKVFDLGPVEHARQFFANDYADSFLPTWLLWIAGLTTPVVKLVAGAMLLVGLRVRAVQTSLLWIDRSSAARCPDSGHIATVCYPRNSARKSSYFAAIASHE
jgi:uncharacterized membrane protein YphA (DoxX/SURF4 family)